MHEAERKDLRVAVDSAGARFDELVRSLSDSEGGIALDDVVWTAAETAAHVVSVLNRCIDDGRRALSPQGLGKLNATCLEEVGERRPPALAEILTELRRQFIDDAATANPMLYRPYHCHTEVTIDQLLAMVLGEYLVHGRDIAIGTGRSWDIGPSEAAMVWRAGALPFGGWLDPSTTATLQEIWQIELGEQQTIELRFSHGDLDMRVGHGLVGDCFLAVDPAEFLLTVPYGRLQPDQGPVERLASYFLEI